MAVHFIRVLRELTDKASKTIVTSEPYFYNDIDSGIVGSWEPNTDIFETNKEVIIRLELANVSRDHISIVVKEGKLHISGYREPIQIENQVYYHQMEIHFGDFRKIIALPEILEHSEITAVLHEGILDVRISKQSKPVEIPIVINADSE